MSAPMMKCGHAANATREGQPVCVICFGIVPGADVVDDSPPDLTGRFAICSYVRDASLGHSGKYAGRKDPVPSSPKLAFFQHHPDREFDEYYCGCWG